MRSKEELIDFFLEGDGTKYDGLVEILAKILFEQAPIEGFSVEDVDLSQIDRKDSIIQ